MATESREDMKMLIEDWRQSCI